jgi:hypothetical protein
MMKLQIGIKKSSVLIVIDMPLHFLLYIIYKQVIPTLPNENILVDLCRWTIVHPLLVCILLGSSSTEQRHSKLHP